MFRISTNIYIHVHFSNTHYTIHTTHSTARNIHTYIYVAHTHTTTTHKENCLLVHRTCVVCTYVCMSECVCARVYVRMYILLYVCVCVFVFPTCNFFLEYNPRFSVAPFQLWPVGRTARRQPHRRHTFTFLTKRYNVVLSFRTTRVRVPLARNPSPLQYPTLHVEYISVRSLLRQPRSALEAGPS